MCKFVIPYIHRMCYPHAITKIFGTKEEKYIILGSDSLIGLCNSGINIFFHIVTQYKINSVTIWYLEYRGNFVSNHQNKK